ncbi:transmembrane protein, putative [Medicago truncatula]|uniref:Transmembrane protein, putative n=1 Tax=Medicago truncatula TaxID=3880 RepID=G7IJ52_MEDTR|nr:transmembrane protein, putative [Medicago truncatula]
MAFMPRIIIGDLLMLQIIRILPFYAINYGVVSLFAYSPFTFLAMSVFDVIYFINLNE